MNRTTVRLLLVFVAVLVGSGLLVYFFLDRSARQRTNIVNDPPAASASQPAVTAGSPSPPNRTRKNEADALLTELFGSDDAQAEQTEESSRGLVAARILMRFMIAAFLATFLAFRWRRGLTDQMRNPYVAQTQILLAVVAAAMMMIVGDSAARAFGIFAAASLVRFRTNIRDPKETTVLLVCLGVGLACGVGRLDMALTLGVFVLFTLWILEHFEEGQIFRSMELCVASRKVDHTNEILKRIFSRHKFDIELLEINRPDADEPMGKIVYLVNLDPVVRTSRLSDEILSNDPENIDGVEWKQKESKTYIYR